MQPTPGPNHLLDQEGNFIAFYPASNGACRHAKELGGLGLETVPNMGVLTSAHGRPGAGGMEWRVTIELSGADGTKLTHEVARGGGADPHSTLDPLGLTLDDGKMVLAGVERHLVWGRVAE